MAKQHEKIVISDDVIALIEEKIGYKFKDRNVLITAFTHASYANEYNVPSYERLEFLGDSVLNLVVANYLCLKYPDANEGFLTKARAKVVSEKSLADVLKKIGLYKYIRSSSGSIAEEVKKSDAVKCDLFEAITGAILWDKKDLASAEQYVLSMLTAKLNEDFTLENVTDFKSKLLEYCAHAGEDVKFDVQQKSEKPNSGFVAKVYVGGKEMGYGEGASKKKAEQSASKIAYKALGGM